MIDGDPVDLSQDRFQAEHASDSTMAFHLHESDDLWYMEGEERLTVAEALDLLPEIAFVVEDGYARFTLDETTYDERDENTDVTVLVNDTAVDPTSYELQHEDAIRVDVSTNG